MSEVIDPADVRVGDQVEVEAADGSWLARGEVTGIYPQHADEYRIFLLDLDGHQAPVAAKHATVRLVRRAEPEPDPEQVEAIRDTYGHVLRMNLAPEEAVALHRLGVRVSTARYGRCVVTGQDRLRDEIAIAVWTVLQREMPSEANTKRADLAADAVLDKVQAHIDAAREQGDAPVERHLEQRIEHLERRAEAAEQAVQRVRELIDPAAAMALSDFGRRWFDENDIRRALDGTP